MSNFVAAVAERLPGLVAMGDQAAEFSSATCDSCGSTFAGSRHKATQYNPDTREVLEVEVCIDCCLYHANGDVPADWRQHP